MVSVANRIPDRSREPYYRFDMFIASLKRFGVDPTMLGMNEWWGGLMTKPRRLRQWLRGGGCAADTLIVCDAFDIVFVAHPDEVGKAYRGVWPTEQILFNAEKGLFPRGELIDKFQHIEGPWRFLNSGFFIGSPDKILALLEAMWLDDIADDYKAGDDLHGGTGRHINPNDQGWYQTFFAAQIVPMALDNKCRVCQTLSSCEIGEFDLSGEKIRNVATGTEPLVWHFNGGSKDLLMPTFLQKWGLG